MYLNKAIIVGNLTRDPELKSLPSGSKVTDLGIATNRTWNDQSGQKQEATEFHNVVVFGRQAETSAQYLKKGQQVMIEGRLQTRSWDGQDGKKNYRTEIVADRVQFGSKAGGAVMGSAASDPADQPATKSPAKPKDEVKEPEIATIEYPEDDINPEDIPF